MSIGVRKDIEALWPTQVEGNEPALAILRALNSRLALSPLSVALECRAL